MKYWKQVILSLALLAGVSLVAIVPAGNVSAINVLKDQCAINASSPVCEAAKKDNASDMTKVIVNTMLQVLGILAVIMIIVGGIRYTTSNGDASRVKAAKDTITYSVVGLIVAILSFAIVNFVVGRF